MKKYIVTLPLLFVALFSRAQAMETDEYSLPYSSSKFNIGIGLGLDYGGIGGRFEVLPSASIGLMLGLGYNLAGFGYNGGVSVKLAPKKRICPTLNLLYGYNAAIKVVDASEYDKIYYGPSLGFGLMFRKKRKVDNFFNLELFLPFRSSEYYDDIDFLQNQGVFIEDTIPFTISVGFHFAS